MKCLFKSISGQGLVEYALILVLIAIVVMVAVRTLGRTTSTVFTDVNTNLSAR
ncbi:Flp family type IVb pilin [Geomonas terrae]|uniref:Flp family type IVb pilin n=2 Tax=Geobacteraceae TaxID=213422 RepID=A0A4S1CAN4_9BACT|nr:Flp family type IVb pilin [Geomonas terrae]